MITPGQLIDALGVTNNQKTFILRDENGLPHDGNTVSHVLTALSWSNHTPGLPGDLHRVAYAIHKCIFSGRMPVAATLRMQEYRVSKLCGMVAEVYEECHGMTVGQICDVWLIQHAEEL